MTAPIRRTFTALSFVWLALTLLPTPAAAQTAGSVYMLAYPGPPLISGVTGTVDLFAEATDPTGGYEGPTYSNLTWTWSATGPGHLCVDTSTSSTSPTLKVKISPPGNYKVTVKATATWDVSTGGTVSADETFEVTVYIIGVQKLQYTTDPMDPYVDVDGVMYVPLNKYLTFQALSTATDTTFPGGTPV